MSQEQAERVAVKWPCLEGQSELTGVEIPGTIVIDRITRKGWLLVRVYRECYGLFVEVKDGDFSYETEAYWFVK